MISIGHIELIIQIIRQGNLQLKAHCECILINGTLKIYCTIGVVDRHDHTWSGHQRQLQGPLLWYD